ncbi:MBL fold metallo-hydrolase [Heliophilum fasciatum]|uniref:Glyoxylase-like metal-dependent hydrolase (Beta-lactamase superfamily II) n=1 Tax=Heliophilum fasciatum TaxID=35700 RepID=A0A4R2S894_9FIRM|nr:MBL fold metallo-hydrolase [Heliophilum fasciatum]MCW2276909.1 glyoxylase-like metal-dependent hydrolase (beta-lactamase superfamily II) [Heliophilum fasciatum]TCP68631.1 glyoxylase-like metal-dependent hydrolase (beta-lactamase superfamily II) [Heliophilum fasciatum]
MSADQQARLIQWDHGVAQYDLMYGGQPECASGYVITGAVPTLIETGTSGAFENTLAALQALAIAPQDVQYVIVTHIHLDHAGGAGRLLQALPNAKLVVHPRGARHMIDPTKLIASAREVYGDSFEQLFDPIVPVPQERVILAEDGMTLALDGRTLTLLDTPGHARHHVAIYDDLSRGIFSGDTIGLTFPALNQLGARFYCPTSSPTQFDPAALKATLTRCAALQPEVIYFTHYGRHEGALAIIEQNLQWIDTYVQLGQVHYDRQEGWSSIARAMRQAFYEQLQQQGIGPEQPELATLEFDLELNAKGLACFLDRQRD